MTLLNTLHGDLLLVKELVYDVCGLEFKNVQLHTESIEYAACSFELNGNKIEHRCSKITPTKIGQFVTIWKRDTKGITAPFDISDGIDFIIITARSGDHFGQFVFPVTVLSKKNIVSINGKSGKRGIRVYPPWDKPTSKQALVTQEWQSKFFLQITNNTNQYILKNISRLLEIEFHTLNDDQIHIVNEAKQQINKGQFLTHEEIQKIAKEKLKSK